jgi:hypothetical protein
MKVYNVYCKITIPVGAKDKKSAEDLVKTLLVIGHPKYDELSLDDFSLQATEVPANMIAIHIAEEWKGAELFNDENLDGLTPERIANEDREAARKEQIEKIILEAEEKLKAFGIDSCEKACEEIWPSFP